MLFGLNLHLYQGFEKKSKPQGSRERDQKDVRLANRISVQKYPDKMLFMLMKKSISKTSNVFSELI